jgi:Rieske Fe-S protein
MEREEFLKKLGVGTLAACMGCNLVSCSKKADTTPTTNGQNAPAPGSGMVLSTDLNSTLINVGDSKTSNGIIIVRIATGNVVSSFIAVQVACTHEGAAINYNQSQGLFICPLHGSEFSKTGAVIQGPALKALQNYTVTINGTTLTVIA